MLHAVRICALDSRHPDLLHMDLPRSCQQDTSDRASMQLGSPRSHTTRCIWHKTRLCTGVHCASELHNSPQVAKPCPCTALAGRVVQGTAVAGMVPCTLAGMVPCTTMPASAAESGRQTNGRGGGKGGEGAGTHVASLAETRLGTFAAHANGRGAGHGPPELGCRRQRSCGGITRRHHRAGESRRSRKGGQKSQLEQRR